MIPLDLDSSFGTALQLTAIILATFASEDLTCIAVGLLIGSNQIDTVVGLSGCFLGIFVGDLGLWLIGYLAGLGLLQLPLVGRLLPPQRCEGLRRWLDERGATALVIARFLPGARLPLYVACGLFGLSLRRFAYWTFLAALLWTPLLVFLAALLGAPIVQPVIVLLGPGWPVLLLAALLLFLTIRVSTLACTATGRAKLVARVSRLWRWEFWPSWLFYLPVLPWLAYLSLRYRGVLTWTAANPGIPQGGVVGESKHAILAQLPQGAVIPSFLVPPGEPGERLAHARAVIEDLGWSFPLILKPDAGQRGSGVRRAHDLVDVEKYLRRQPHAVIVQTYHPGPFEAGIFYYRLPGEEAGHIFSITDKVFPVLAGDGRSTLEELIWRHPRYRMQAHTFLTRHDAERGRVLAAGEPFALALAGNHCQGTMFRDGAHLVTPELERTVDAIAQHFRGFCIGRFDVRYTDAGAFQAGRDLAVVELNGVTSESTNLYDPSWSLFAAYCTLFRQWSLLYRIGYANRQRGHASTGILELLRLIFSYCGRRQPQFLQEQSPRMPEASMVGEAAQ
jgi:membrane protein DedA with SNARE-associated domain